MSSPDPSHSVPQDLLPHIHLVSSFRYPSVSHINLQDAAKWLMNAPHVARDKSPFFWTYLDKPVDGTILMTWQPSQRMGSNFSTDGFIWAPPEQMYKHDLGNGLILEIYFLKSGYIPGEQYAQHARRRFRLVPAPGHPMAHQPDTNLYIIHYGPCDPADMIPAQMIPYDQRVHNNLQQWQYMQRLGQIRRKEFMLSDRANWPSLPELTRQQTGPQPGPRGIPQQMAYPPQGVPGPPAKRARHSQSQSQQPPIPSLPAPETPIDDEEDVGRGDMFDHLTPREISLGRYQQNHEWMEEILSSPYRIYQITPMDLGLGLKGPLAPLTEGIFTAQGSEVATTAPDKPYVGRLDPALAKEFRKRVEDHIQSETKNMEAMKAAHEKELADMKKASQLRLLEREVRRAEDAGSELWKPHDGADIHNESFKKTVEEIVQEIESSTGRKIESKPGVKCVNQGGYQAPAPEPEPEPVAPAQPAELSRQPSQSSAVLVNAALIPEGDVDMEGTAAGLLDQMHSGLSTTSTPVNNFPTPQPQLSAAQSNAGTPSNVNVQSPVQPASQPPASQQQEAPKTQETAQQPSSNEDVSMGGMDSVNEQQPETTPDQGTGSGDWVVVPKEGATSEATNPTPAAATANLADGAADGASKPAAAPALPTAPATAPIAKPPSAATTPAITEGGSVTFDQNDFSSLGDLDTAGDALAGYDAPALDGSAGELGEGLDLQMDMEESAFGAAFHGVDPSSTDTPGHDM